MDEEKFEQLLSFFKVLGNETRLKILGLLANGERTVGEIADFVELSEPTVSHHLSLMKKLGLVQVRADKNLRIYRLDTGRLEGMNRNIFSQSNLATLAPEAPASAEEKLLQNWIEDGRLKAIPAKFGKRQPILAWIAEQFEPDRRYPERELVEKLQQIHPDHASLRRYLVEMGFMQREKGVYWRVEQER